MFPNARNEKPTTNFNQDIFFLSQKGADESIVRGDASSSELLNLLTTWLSGGRGKLLVRCRLGNPGRYRRPKTGNASHGKDKGQNHTPLSPKKDPPVDSLKELLCWAFSSPDHLKLWSQ